MLDLPHEMIYGPMMTSYSFVIKLYKVTLITSYNRQTRSDQRVYKGARVSYSKCLQSKIVYVMFSSKNSLIRGKLHTLHL